MLPFEMLSFLLAFTNLSFLSSLLASAMLFLTISCLHYHNKYRLYQLHYLIIPAVCQRLTLAGQVYILVDAPLLTTYYLSTDGFDNSGCTSLFPCFTFGALLTSTPFNDKPGCHTVKLEGGHYSTESISFYLAFDVTIMTDSSSQPITTFNSTNGSVFYLDSYVRLYPTLLLPSLLLLPHHTQYKLISQTHLNQSFLSVSTLLLHSQR